MEDFEKWFYPNYKYLKVKNLENWAHTSFGYFVKYSYLIPETEFNLVHSLDYTLFVAENSTIPE